MVFDKSDKLKQLGIDPSDNESTGEKLNFSSI